jgi:hypothetical protein
MSSFRGSFGSCWLPWLRFRQQYVFQFRDCLLLILALEVLLALDLNSNVFPPSFTDYEFNPTQLRSEY